MSKSMYIMFCRKRIRVIVLSMHVNTHLCVLLCVVYTMPYIEYIYGAWGISNSSNTRSMTTRIGPVNVVDIVEMQTHSEAVLDRLSSIAILIY